MTYMLCVRSQNVRRLSPQSNQVRVTPPPWGPIFSKKALFYQCSTPPGSPLTC